MDTDKIQDIIRVSGESELHKMELEVDDIKIRVERGAAMDSRTVYMGPVMMKLPPPAATTPRAAPFPAMEVRKTTGTWVRVSPVSTCYSVRSQGGTLFVGVDQQVKKRDVLCIIEAMKVVNETPSPVDGIVQEILVAGEATVEFDQELTRIDEVA